MNRRSPFTLPLVTLLLTLLAALVVLIAVMQLSGRHTVTAQGRAGYDLGHFHPVETDTQQLPFRWSKQLSSVVSPRFAYREKLTLTLNGSRPPGFEPTAIDVVLNGRQLATIPANSTLFTHTITYADLGLSSELNLELRPQATFYPSDRDWRELGFVFYRLEATAERSGLGLRLPAPLVTVLWLLTALALWALWRGGWRIVAGGLAVAFAGLHLALGPTSFYPYLYFELLLATALALFANRRSVEAGLARGWGWLRERWPRRLRWLGAPLFYTALSVVLTWPYALHLGDWLPGWPMDNFNFLYKIWWIGHAVLGRPTAGGDLVYNPDVYYPAGFNLAQGELTPINTLLTLPITATLGPVWSYNLSQFASFILSGWAMYLLVKYLLITYAPPKAEQPQQSPNLQSTIYNLQSIIPLFAGIVFAFAPWHFNQMMGHMQIMGIQWFALTFLFVDKAVRGRRWQDGALAGLFFALCAWQAWYFAAIAGVVVGFYGLIRLIMQWRVAGSEYRVPSTEANFNPTSKIQHLKAAAAFVVVTLVMILPFLIPYLQLRGEAKLGYTVKAANGSSALPSDYLIPSQLHPIWGGTMFNAHTANLNISDYNLYLGIVPIVLAVLAFALGERAGRGLRRLWLAVGGLAMIFSFGLLLDVGGELERFGLVQPSTGVLLPMPGLLLYNYVPGFNGVRAYARFGVIVVLAVAVLAAFGLIYLLRRSRLSRYPLLTTMLLTGVVLFEFWATPFSFGYSRAFEQPMDRWLKQQPGQFTVAMFSVDRAWKDGPAMWGSVYHRKRIAYGYETFVPPSYAVLEDRLDAFPDEAAINLIAAEPFNSRYIAVSSRYPGEEDPGRTLSSGIALTSSRFWAEVRARLAANPRLRLVDVFHQQSMWVGDWRLFDFRPDIEWHCLPDDVYLYEVVQ